MQNIVNVATQCWILLRRRRYRYEYRIVQRSLRNAWKYIEKDFTSRASAIERGCVLPEHDESVRILQGFEQELANDCAVYLRD